ncbi:RICIN domain-containing protein [Kitasatospora cathayae]|uniref:Ricin B lectin domain-containing protein n=1 Tax=Kitasatospora cathayae TaxID=3004092 RepID=A0ABY7QJA5_9ACTN|nr:hypothetical protein [Kitasatospora sp. HUAS 3-15]WBP91941.1 hypothetical protein O1G21_39820 [Kitasatospora sp. HUAS 3-15]
MKKFSVLRLIAAAVAIPAIGLATASPASADGNVSWENKGSAGCLQGVPNNYVGMEPCGNLHTHWHDVQLGDTNWIEYLLDGDGKWTGQCLDSNTYGSVYVGPCDSPSKNNLYQRWSEEKWSGGWVLKNVATGRCLAVYYDFSVQTLPCNADIDSKYWK